MRESCVLTRIRSVKKMAMSTSWRCPETGLSVSYAYKQGCRCVDCRANKMLYTMKERNRSEDVKRWKNEHPEATRAMQRRANEKQWLKRRGALLEQQQGKCAICGQGAQGFQHSTRLVLDHDHVTGQTRGLLCGHCNVGLGHFQDSIDLLHRAAAYLTLHTLQEGA